MQLDKVTVQIRPRGGWEALDLGFQMARSLYRPMWSVWLALYLPAAIVLNAAFHAHLWIAALLLWWLKPLFERFLLHVVSRAVFGETPTVRATLAAWREILRNGVFWGLTLQRLNPARSFVLPVWQLEQQSGREGRERRTTLGKRMRGYAVWLTLACAHFETVLFLSIGLAIVLFAPASAESGFEFSKYFTGNSGDDATRYWEWDDALAYVIAASVMEPFYVAAGFSLYLNRRAALEGWDIEIALRRLDARQAAARPGGALATLVAAGAIGLAALLAAAPDARAAQNTPARQEIRAVLKAREFQISHEEMQFQLRADRTDEKKDAKSNDNFWERAGKIIALIVQGLAWAVAAGIAIWLLLLLRRHYMPGAAAGKAWQPPQALFGLDIAPGSLPADVAAAAAELARAGRLREALSLLYRGALSVLVHRDRVQLGDADTETDCLRAARQALPQEAAAYFARLVDAWIGTAWAGRQPQADEALALAQTWAAHFAAPRPAAAA